ncbi:hypothetical protein [Actinomadura viridis]|uniref:Uncharacterized protein n=1 Tax=Actinomadura viridis TaxID=58110 RepID=A0A931DH41_9ACTN|nr:hypothetical protein [Actinomadura viridis]MBG6089965.1 hypothetical protein [Actinomadura viridis]
MTNLPMWAYPVIAVVCFPLMLLTYLAWASRRARMDSDLWEGGDPSTPPLDSEWSRWAA